jgi:hypothetical protein
MSFSFIHQLLDNGVNEEELLASLTKQIPHLAKKASKMFSGGWSPKQILNAFSQDKEVQKSARKGLKPVTPSEIAAMRLRNSYDNIPQSQGNESREALTDFTKKAAPVAVAGLTSQLAGPMAEAAMSRALPHASNLLKTLTSPQSGNAGTSQIPPSNLGMPQVVNSNVNPSQPPINQINAPSMPQAAEPMQPEGISNPKEYLEKHGILDKVKSLLKAGNTPEGVAAALGIKRGGGAKIDPELQKNIEAYAKEPQLQEEKGLSEEGKQHEAKPIEKNATVIAPQGVGEVKAIRNGKALIEVDGKRHEVDESELESSPIPEKDLSDLYDDLIKGIEGETEEDVSRMVQWAGYNPDTNTLQFLPHTGDMYTYNDISEEDAALLRDVLSVRKTSGSNFIGAWKKDSKSPIGAALSKLIRKLQSEREGKGNEYSAKHGTIYSAYEPAIQAKKKKKKT